ARPVPSPQLPAALARLARADRLAVESPLPLARRALLVELELERLAVLPGEFLAHQHAVVDLEQRPAAAGVEVELAADVQLERKVVGPGLVDLERVGDRRRLVERERARLAAVAARVVVVVVALAGLVGDAVAALVAAELLAR